MPSRYFRPKVLRLGHSTEVWAETRCATEAFKPRPTLFKTKIVLFATLVKTKDVI